MRKQQCSSAAVTFCLCLFLLLFENVGNEGKLLGYWRLIFGGRFVCICIVALLDDLYLAFLVMKFKLDSRYNHFFPNASRSSDSVWLQENTEK